MRHADPWRALNGRHPDTAQCVKGEERKRRRLTEAETREILERAFKAYGEPIQNVSTFRYLGRVLTAKDDDWILVVVNLRKAQNSWGPLSWIFSQEGADPKVSGNFYKAMAQAVLLFGVEKWVLNQRMEWALDSFNTGWKKVSQGISRENRRMGAGTNRLWQRHFSKRD